MRKSVMLIIFTVLVTAVAVVHADVNDRPRWATPDAMAVKRVSDTPVIEQHPDFMSNLDCTTLTYRLVGHQDIRKGCFTATAFGMLESDHDIAIFNGTDEALPLRPSSAHQVLAPWPQALNLVTLDAANTGGSYINLYKSPLSVMRDERGWDGQLTDKRLSAPPDIHLANTSGKPLIVNAQTLAFSDGGSWAVMETLGGSFVRMNLASLGQRPFARSFAAPGWPGTLFQSQVAVSSDGSYVAIGNAAADSLKIYDLQGCSGPVCPAHDYLPFLKQRISGLQKVRHVRFLNDGLLSFEAVTSGSTHDGVYELAPAADISSLADYLGLGDSFTSGEGAFDYLAGTDTAANTCHLSANSYPLLLTRDLFSAAGGHSVACSGAVIRDVGATGNDYQAQAKDSFDPGSVVANFRPGYVAQHRFVSQYQPRLVTVSIGGNDVGFGDILQRCVTPHITRHWSDETCYNTYESRQELLDMVDRTVPRWTALYRQLQTESPGSTLYAIGYPSIASDLGRCPLNVNLSKSELEFAEELIHYLDGSIKKAAADADVPYVDISQALAGHRLCEASGGSVAVNGLTAGNDFGVFGIGLLGRESYHPNALGHQLLEQTILRQTDNLSARNHDGPASTPETGNLLDAPRTGRPLNTLILDKITDERARPGSTIRLNISGGRDGLRPNSVYTVHLDGPTRRGIGETVSEPGSDVTAAVTIPPDVVEPEAHVIDVVGPGQGDKQVDIRQPVYISAPTSSDLDDPGPLARDETAGHVSKSQTGQVLGANYNRKAKFVRRPSGSGHKNEPVWHLLDTGTSGQAAVLAAAVILGAAVFYACRIIKSDKKHFGRLCNNWLKKDYKNCGRCFTIGTMRKFGVVVFCLLLFVSLVSLATSTSTNTVITDPQKIETWLGQSGVYSSFVSTAIEQADKSAGSDQSGGVSLSDSAVKQAAEATFSPQLIRHNVDIFLNSNYAWLDGKTAKPEFTIDFTQAKISFAKRVGNYVRTYLATLPVCSAAQQAKIDLSTADPLNLSCRPAALNPAAEGKLVTSQIESNQDFLSNPVITQDTFNSKSQSQADTPYYEQFSGAPSAYKFNKQLPWITGAFVILAALAVYFLAERRRGGVKAIAITLGAAGLVLVLTKFIADQVFKAIERHVFNDTTVGQLQKSLTTFFHHVESQLVKVDLWFGIGYLLIAAILIGILILTRQRGLRIPKPLQMLTPKDSDEEEESDTPEPEQEPKPSPKPSRRPKPPRLVQ